MLLTPLALALALLSVPIILMYVLKLRRQEHVVPSTFLWRQAIDDMQANAPWQRLRFNILLLLQLLILIALVISLARPAYSRSHVIAGDVVVILDQSYGMQARDGGTTRYAEAQARAHTLSSELGDSNVMSVIGMGAQPHLAIAESSDSGAIGRAIDGLHPSVAGANPTLGPKVGFLDALSLAASLARGGQNTRVIVLTSRESGISSLPLQVSFPVDIERFGGPLHDLGVTAFQASHSKTSVDALARVSNFGSATEQSNLQLFVDGTLADVRPVSVAPGAQQNVVWNDIPDTAGRLEVRLTHADDVSIDKTAFAVVPSPPVRSVLLVSKGNFFLEAGLLDDPSVRLSTVSPLAYTPTLARRYDLLVFDGFLPSSQPAGSALVVSPPAGRLGPLRFGALRPAGNVTPTSSSTLASLLQYVDLSDVHVAQARVLSASGWLATLARSGGSTVLAAGQNGDSRLAVVSFDLQRSDWPLRISFPITLQNLLRYLAPGLTLGQTDVVTGAAVQLFPPPATRELRVTRPGGGVTVVSAPFPPFTDTAHPGIYSVTALSSNGVSGTSRSTAFAVNFFPARPAPAPGPAVLHLGHGQSGKALTSSAPVTFSWAFVLAALAILGLEWWIAFRGTRLS